MNQQQKEEEEIQSFALSHIIRQLLCLSSLGIDHQLAQNPELLFNIVKNNFSSSSCNNEKNIEKAKSEIVSKYHFIDAIQKSDFERQFSSFFDGANGWVEFFQFLSSKEIPMFCVAQDFKNLRESEEQQPEENTSSNNEDLENKKASNSPKAKLFSMASKKTSDKKNLTKSKNLYELFPERMSTFHHSSETTTTSTECYNKSKKLLTRKLLSVENFSSSDFSKMFELLENVCNHNRRPLNYRFIFSFIKSIVDAMMFEEEEEQKQEQQQHSFTLLAFNTNIYQILVSVGKYFISSSNEFFSNSNYMSIILHDFVKLVGCLIHQVRKVKKYSSFSSSSSSKKKENENLFSSEETTIKNVINTIVKSGVGSLLVDFGHLFRNPEQMADYLKVMTDLIQLRSIELTRSFGLVMFVSSLVRAQQYILSSVKKSSSSFSDNKKENNNNIKDQNFIYAVGHCFERFFHDFVSLKEALEIPNLKSVLGPLRYQLFSDPKQRDNFLLFLSLSNNYETISITLKTLRILVDSCYVWSLDGHGSSSILGRAASKSSESMTSQMIGENLLNTGLKIFDIFSNSNNNNNKNKEKEKAIQLMFSYLVVCNGIIKKLLPEYSACIVSTEWRNLIFMFAKPIFEFLNFEKKNMKNMNMKIPVDDDSSWLLSRLKEEDNNADNNNNNNNKLPLLCHMATKLVSLLNNITSPLQQQEAKNKNDETSKLAQLFENADTEDFIINIAPALRNPEGICLIDFISRIFWNFDGIKFQTEKQEKLCKLCVSLGTLCATTRTTVATWLLGISALSSIRGERHWLCHELVENFIRVADLAFSDTLTACHLIAAISTTLTTPALLSGTDGETDSTSKNNEDNMIGNNNNKNKKSRTTKQHQISDEKMQELLVLNQLFLRPEIHNIFIEFSVHIRDAVGLQRYTYALLTLVMGSERARNFFSTPAMMKTLFTLESEAKQRKLDSALIFLHQLLNFMFSSTSGRGLAESFTCSACNAPVVKSNYFGDFGYAVVKKKC